ncbi:MAG: CHC2 zinc finger domain-containing protein, partial [Armatimonadota bacterium]
MAGVTGREAAEAYKRQVKEAIGREALAFYGRYLQLRRKGKRHVALCPFHNERTPSLIVTGKGEFHCFGCGAHGDGIDFLQRRDGLSFPEALAEAGRQVGVRSDCGVGAVSSDCRARACTAPAVIGDTGSRRGTSPRPTEDAATAETRTVYAVRNAAGELLAEHVRLDLPDGGKRFEWWRAGKLGLGGRAQGSLPLYGTAEVAAARTAGDRRPVVICEGEKAAEAVRAAGQLALGTYGANVTPTPDALREAGLAETVVVLWPDADEPGRQHMAQVGRALVAVGATVEVAQWAEALPGADAWDFGQDHTAEELGDLLCQSAVSFEEWVAAAEAEPTKPGPKMQFCTADKLEATLGETTWLWPHWVPYGYVTIVGGEPGCGKSML